MVAQGFAGGRAGGNNNMVPLPGKVSGSNLVCIEFRNTLLVKSVFRRGQYPRGPGCIVRVAAGKIPHVGDRTVLVETVLIGIVGGVSVA